MVDMAGVKISICSVHQLKEKKIVKPLRLRKSSNIELF